MGSVFTEITCSREVITLRPFNTDDQRTEQSGGKQDQLVIGLLLVQKKKAYQQLKVSLCYTRYAFQ